MTSIHVGYRQHKFLPIVQVTLEGVHCEDEPILIDLIFQVMDFAKRQQAIIISENDIPSIRKGMKIQVCFTAQFKTMLDANSYVKEISNM